ncbi:MAG: carboxypeptidase-like regulatory domain-containing protein [Pyrinomonadaceae bacterium]
MPAFALLLAFSASSFPQSPIAGHYVIAGQAFDGEGRVLADAQVTALPDQLIGKAPIATTDKAGKFTIEASKTGKWMLFVSKLSAGYPSNYFRYFYPEDPSRTEVTVPESGVVEPVVLRTGAPMGMLQVQLESDAAGQSIEDVRVKLCRLESPGYCFTTVRPRVLSPGVIRIPVAASRTAVTISAAGYADGDEVLPNGVPPGSTKVLSFRLRSPAKSDNLGLPAPAVIAPRDGEEVFAFPRSVKLEWAPVPGAASYSIDLDICSYEGRDQTSCASAYPLQHPVSPPTSGIKGTTFEFTFVGGQPGRWRVYALDSEGRPGKKTSWQTILFKL